MNVIRSHVDGNKHVTSHATDFTDGVLYNRPFSRPQQNRLLFQQASSTLDFLIAQDYLRRSETTVIPTIDRTSFVAGKPGAVCSERDQICLDVRPVLELYVISFRHIEMILRNGSPYLRAGY